MIIRKATIKDIPELVILMEQLGYPTSVDKMKLRFNAINNNPSYHTLVADLEGKVVGMTGLNTGLFYEYDGSYVWIVAFIVDTNYRRKGIGKKLIQEAECWAREQGAIAIALNSGNREERKDAHQFYLSMGYKAKSIGFGKSLI
nr:GNAT family N-acetyltransferase [uncultured Metabacillus sp.]